MEFAGIFFYGLQVTASYQYHKFITAQTVACAAGITTFLRTGCNFMKNRISLVMSVMVIDMFKVIQIVHDQAKGLLCGN